MKTLRFGFLIFAFVGCSSTLQPPHWEFTGGPKGLNIATILPDPDESAHLYAGLLTGDVYSSSDEGTQWNKLSTIFPQTVIHKLVRHPEQRYTLYALTEAGLFVSEDRGSVWRSVPIIPGEKPAPAVFAFAIDPWNTHVMYAGAKGRGIYKSIDGGKNWKASSQGLSSADVAESEVSDIVVDVTKPDIVFAALTGRGVIRSTDAGATWTIVTSDLGTTAKTASLLLLHPKQNGWIIFGTTTGNFFASRNGGLLWTPTRDGHVVGRLFTLSCAEGNGDYVAAGTETGIITSTDFGMRWYNLIGSLPHVPASVVFSPTTLKTTFIAFGEAVGVQLSTNNGEVWRHIDATIGGSSIQNITTGRSGDQVFCASGGSLHLLGIDKPGWSSISTGLPGTPLNSLALDAASPPLMYAGTPDGIFKTTDGGKSWDRASQNLPRMRVLSMAVHPVIRNRVYVTSAEGVFISTNFGSTWSRSKPYENAAVVRSLVFAPKDAGFVRAATAENVILLSSDGGFTWDEARFGIENDDITSLTLDADNKNLGYAWCAGGDAYRSTNGGTAWERFATPWKHGDAVLISVDRFQPSEAVALINGRQVYYTQSAGAAWIPVEAGDLKHNVLSATWNGATKSLYVGTKNEGVFRLSLEGFVKKRFGE